jgi:phospholipid/cholesterol/gamma-HCH transport system substrate-binding protein
MKQGLIETIAGFFVLAVAFGALTFAYNVTDYPGSDKNYNLFAHFQNIDGISKGSDVKLAGIKIGTVSNIELENDTYYAILNLKLDKNVVIPDDSSAIVSTTGILGGKYIRLTPGGSDTNFEEGGRIRFTQSTINIEDMVAKLMYSLTSGK